ncbi:hypothetical protein KHC28_00615 [Ancylobacter sonchi]|uniref:hypothetical protein n=1 Tax=Ancylobacter sonchi TaxID=1937790 RepID=UPI001BD6C95B|nr:hypothetical protein [Ancylobacter sonchi]MBS7532166.1 hypothetical protein [Ancylobacter sonchi]
MAGYGPYVVGVIAGLIVALALSAALAINGTPQLLLFGLLPALGGAVAERVHAARR